MQGTPTVPGLQFPENGEECPATIVGENMHLTRPVVNYAYFRELEKRMHGLERLVLERTRQIEDDKDRLHSANQLLFKAGIQNQAATHEIRKLNLLQENTRIGLAKAVQMVSERDNEIVSLKRKLRELRNLAARINRKVEKETMEYDETNNAFVKLLVSTRGAEILPRMAESEIRSFQRIEERRKKYLKEQQAKLLMALDAMCFLTQPAANADDKSRQPMRVSRMKTRNPKKQIRVTVRDI
jgi:hypothetical protein